MRKPRRLLGALVLATSLAAVPSAVAGAGPTHEIGGPSFDMTLAPGEMCPFGVHWVQDASKMRTITFAESNGDTKVTTVGTMLDTFTNLSKPDASMEVGIAGHAVMTIHPDGSFDFQLSGKSSLGIMPSDPGGPGLFLIMGRVHFAVGADGSTTELDPFIGHVVDLCEALE